MPVCEGGVEPQVEEGDCCPSCPVPDDGAGRPCTDPLSQEVHPDGAEWTLDRRPCTVHSCDNGIISSEQQFCLSPQCPEGVGQVRIPGQCCAICAPETTARPMSTTEDCSLVDCLPREDLDCGEGVRPIPGPCCPMCPPEDGSCMARDGTGLHPDGDHWIDPSFACRHLWCNAGEISEAIQDCARPQCENPVPVPGQVRCICVGSQSHDPNSKPDTPARVNPCASAVTGPLCSAAGSVPTPRLPPGAASIVLATSTAKTSSGSMLAIRASCTPVATAGSRKQPWIARRRCATPPSVSEANVVSSGAHPPGHPRGSTPLSPTPRSSNRLASLCLRSVMRCSYASSRSALLSRSLFPGRHTDTLGPVCPDTDTTTRPGDGTCTDSAGVRHRDGVSWTTDNEPCSMFMCTEGTISEAHMDCEEPSCQDPINTEGECCPVCPDNDGTCTDPLTDDVYSNLDISFGPLLTCFSAPCHAPWDILCLVPMLVLLHADIVLAIRRDGPFSFSGTPAGRAGTTRPGPASTTSATKVVSPPPSCTAPARRARIRSASTASAAPCAPFPRPWRWPMTRRLLSLVTRPRPVLLMEPARGTAAFRSAAVAPVALMYVSYLKT